MDLTPPPTLPAPEPASIASPAPIISPPSRKQQSWGTVVSIVVIVLMIIVGAFYAWGQRIAAERAAIAPLSATSTGQ